MMNIQKAIALPAVLVLVTACGPEESPSQASTVQQQTQGILTTSQQEALNAAGAVEQTLLEAAEAQKEELNRRLQRN